MWCHSFNCYSISLKYIWHKFFYYLIRKNFQNDEEWHLFYFDCALNCWVIQDFDLCELLMTCDCHIVDIKHIKMEYLWRLFLHGTGTLYSCYSCPKVPWYVHNDISIVTQWVPGPPSFKRKNQSFSPSRSVIFSCCSFSGCEGIWT